MPGRKFSIHYSIKIYLTKICIYIYTHIVENKIYIFYLNGFNLGPYFQFSRFEIKK